MRKSSITMRFLILIPLILISTRSYCQELSYRQFTVKDGLPGSIVYHTVQDKNGFIWFATNQGVSRFDGRVFRNYTKEDGLPDNEILKLYLDKYNNIWCISFLGVPCVFYNNTIIRFDSCRGVRSFCEDALTDSIVLMMTDFNKGDCGYYKSVNRQGEWKFRGNLKPVTGTFDFPVLRVSSPQHLNFSFSCRSDSAQIVSVNNGVTEKQYAVKAFLRYNWLPFSRQQYSALSSDRKGILCLAGDSLYYADMVGIRPLLFLRPMGINNSERDDVNSLYWENDSTLWICCRSKGLLCIKNFLGPQPSVSFFFPTSYCTAIIKDQEDGYWITTHSEGVFYLPNLSFYSAAAFPDLANKSVRCIRALDGQHVVAGFSNGNVMVLDNSRFTGRIFPQWAGRNKNNRIMDIRRYVDGSIMVATDAGLHLIPVSGASRLITSPRSFKEFFIQSDSIVIVATADGIERVRLDGKPNYFRIKASRSTCIAGQKQDFYWGGLRGMRGCHGDSVYDLGARYPPLSGMINHIDIAPDSAIWVSTEQGIVILRKCALTLLKKEQGLSSNLCKHVSFDDGVAWVSTDKGISRIDYSWANDRLDYRISTITEEDGLTANDVNQTIASGEYIWAATARGISFFSKKYFSHSVGEPLINITRVVNGDTSLLSDTIILSPQRNRLLIELAGISYRSGREIHYEYRLKGLDSNWTRIASNNIELSRLPFGQYVFQARAVDRWGKKSGQPKSVVIIHSPPFWQTTWFFVASYLVMALLIGAGFYAFHRARQQKKEKEYALKKKMQDLEMMALRAQMNPHFIFNCLTSIQYHIMRADIKNASTYLHKFSTLIRQTLQNSTASVISLREEVKLLQLYMDLEKLRFGEKMEYSIELSSELEPDNQFIPSMIIQPYVENAIKHGISPPENSKGVILVRFSRSGNYIECVVDDNGPGIRLSPANSSKSDPGHRSMGTRITENRIDTLNLLQKEPISIDVVDKQGSGLSGSGTIIRLSFPITSD